MEQNSEIIIYTAPDGTTKLQVQLEDETVWLTQEQMAMLFGKGRTTITEHIGNIFKEGELNEKEVCRLFRHTTKHGAIEGKTQNKQVKYDSVRKDTDKLTLDEIDAEIKDVRSIRLSVTAQKSSA